MRIEEIKVSAGRTFNHPFEQYSNLRCDVHLGARLDPDEDPAKALASLQAQAEEAAENHKQDLLENIRKLERLSRANEEITALEERMAQADERIKSLRRSVAAYQGGTLSLSSDQGGDETGATL